MSGEDPRRVADYFVVAGLPRDVEKQQPLDDYGLEVSLKPSAYQDPITDITVRRRNTSAAGKILSLEGFFPAAPSVSPRQGTWLTKAGP